MRLRARLQSALHARLLDLLSQATETVWDMQSVVVVIEQMTVKSDGGAGEDWEAGVGITGVVRAELRADRIDDLALEPLVADLVVSPLFVAAADDQDVTERARATLFEIRDALRDHDVAIVLRFNVSGHILRRAPGYTRPALMVGTAPQIGPGHAGQYTPVEEIGQ